MTQHDDSTELFYNQIRLIVVIFLFHAIVFLIANRIIKNFQCTFQQDDFITERNDITISKICHNICSFIGGLSLSAYVLLPLSIVLNEILIMFPDNFYFKWIDSELLHKLYISVHNGIKFSLFLIPFTFSLIQSSGTTSGSLMSKLFESVSLAGIFHFIIFIISWMSSSIIRLFIDVDTFSDIKQCKFNQEFDAFSYFHYFDRIHLIFNKEISYAQIYYFVVNLSLIYIHIAYSIFSFIGLTVSLVSTPIGLIFILIKIVKRFQSSIPVFISKMNLDRRFKEKQIDREYYDTVISCHKILLDDPTSITCHDYIQKIDQEIILLQASLRNFYLNYFISWSKPIIYFSILICILLTLGTVLAFVGMNILELIVGIIWNIYSLISSNAQSDLSSANPSYFGRYFLFSDFRIGVRSSSKLGYFGALIQIILIHFLLITSVFGFFDGPIANKISIFSPTKNGTTTYQLLANVSVLLFLTSALPLQAVLLGFTAINPPEDIYNPRFSPFVSNFDTADKDENESQILSWIYNLVLSKSDLGKKRHLCEEPNVEEEKKSIFANLLIYWLPDLNFFKEDKTEFSRNNLPLPKLGKISWNLLILLCYNIGFLATTIWIIKRKKSQDPTAEEFWRNIQNLVSPLYGVRPWIRRNRRNMNRKLSQ